MTQVLPFADVRVLRVYRQFERLTGHAGSQPVRSRQAIISPMNRPTASTMV